jgi:hypothetical protein
MLRFAHRRIVRATLTVVLVLATQLAFAGQVCRAVMAGNGPDSGPMNVMSITGGALQPPFADRQPCCDGSTKAANPCFLTAFGAEKFVTATAGDSPPFDLGPPGQEGSTFTAGNLSSPTVPPSARSAESSVPAYLLFHRFLN